MSNVDLVAADGTALATFLATTIGDIVLLMLRFSQPSARLRARQIVPGRYLNFSWPFGRSASSALSATSHPPAIGLLGLIPIGLGWVGSGSCVRAMATVMLKQRCQPRAAGSDLWTPSACSQGDMCGEPAQNARGR